MTIAAIGSLWIDENGRQGDLERAVGRLGDDVRLFALHTLGWIRVQEVLRYIEIEFDPRATYPASIAALITLVRDLERSSRLSFVKASAYTGRSWISYVCTDREIDGLADWIWAVAEFGGTPTVPSAIEVSDLPDQTITNDSDPDLHYLLGTWCTTGGTLDRSEPSPWPMKFWSGPRPDSNLKILHRNREGQVAFGAYRPALTSLWAPEVSDRFVNARVEEAVPDRALAQAVVCSALRTLAGGQPRAERFTGPCLRSDGTVEELDWLRVSLPTACSATGVFDSLIVFCRRLSVDDQKRMAG